MARLGKVTGISSVLVAAAASAPELQSNNTVPSISPCCTALQNIIARVGGFNGISKPAVGRRREARRGFIRNHKFIFGHRLDRCLSPDLSLALENFSNALSRCFKSAGCFPACKSSLTSTTKPYLSLLMSSGHVIVNCTMLTCLRSSF